MDVDLLELIRQERRRRGWSMRAAAAVAGVSNTTWSRMESGAVPITAPMARHIADAFDWPDDWETNPPTVSHPSATVDAEELLATIRRELAEHEARVEALLAEYTGGSRTNVNHETDAGRQRGSLASVDGPTGPRTVEDAG